MDGVHYSKRNFLWCDRELLEWAEVYGTSMACSLVEGYECRDGLAWLIIEVKVAKYLNWYFLYCTPIRRIRKAYKEVKNDDV